MAAIATADQEERVREQIKTAVAAYREMLDTFVSDRMRRAAAEAEQVRPRQPSGRSSPSIKPDDRHAADKTRSSAARGAGSFDRRDSAQR